MHTWLSRPTKLGRANAGSMSPSQERLLDPKLPPLNLRQLPQIRVRSYPACRAPADTFIHLADGPLQSQRTALTTVTLRDDASWMTSSSPESVHHHATAMSNESGTGNESGARARGGGTGAALAAPIEPTPESVHQSATAMGNESGARARGGGAGAALAAPISSSSPPLFVSWAEPPAPAPHERLFVSWAQSSWALDAAAALSAARATASRAAAAEASALAATTIMAAKAAAAEAEAAAAAAAEAEAVAEAEAELALTLAGAARGEANSELSPRAEMAQWRGGRGEHSARSPFLTSKRFERVRGCRVSQSPHITSQSLSADEATRRREHMLTQSFGPQFKGVRHWNAHLASLSDAEFQHRYQREKSGSPPRTAPRPSTPRPASSETPPIGAMSLGLHRSLPCHSEPSFALLRAVRARSPIDPSLNLMCVSPRGLRNTGDEQPSPPSPRDSPPRSPVRGLLALHV